MSGDGVIPIKLIIDQSTFLSGPRKAQMRFPKSASSGFRPKWGSKGAEKMLFSESSMGPPASVSSQMLSAIVLPEIR